MSSVGKRIKAARKAADLTQAELAKLTKMSRSHIGAIEIDHYKPSLTTLELIANALGISVSVLLDDNESTEIKKENELVDAYRNLNVEGQNILFSLLKSLSNTYPASAAAL